MKQREAAEEKAAEPEKIKPRGAYLHPPAERYQQAQEAYKAGYAAGQQAAYRRGYEEGHDVLSDAIENAPPAELLADLNQSMWRQLLLLVHPDKHSDTERATKVTAWLTSELSRQPMRN